MADCIIEVGHKTHDRTASWLMDGDPEKPICDHHKGYYETTYDDYLDIEWVPIEPPRSGSRSVYEPCGEHDGCNYRAVVIDTGQDDQGEVWFCNKCGWTAPRSDSSKEDS